MIPLITVVDIAHTTPQGVSSGETLQGVSHYDGAKDWAGYRMHHPMTNNWEGVDCGLGRIPPCINQSRELTAVWDASSSGQPPVTRLVNLAAASMAMASMGSRWYIRLMTWRRHQW